MLLRRFAVALLISLLLVGCAPAQPGTIEPMPTLLSSATPPGFTLDDAERVASSYLYGWQVGDYPAMHALINFSSREANPLEDFTRLYQDVATTMTMTGVTTQIRAIDRDPSAARVVRAAYDVTFETSLVGTFSDADRQLVLVFDARDNDWRVAWSRADLFPEFADGGNLRLITSSVNRANIYDRNGVVLATQDDTVIVTVSVVRGNIPDEAACLRVLEQASRLTQEQLITRLNAQPADWVNEITQIEAESFVTHQAAMEAECAATFGNRPARRYPSGSLMPHVLGTVGYLDAADLPPVLALGFQQDAILGRSGIERTWDDTLRGRPRVQLVLEAANGARLRTIADIPARPAEAVWLTIDSGLQQQVLDILTRAYAENAEGWAQRSAGAAAVVMDVNTGEILALVSFPTYDANAFTPFPSIGREAAQDIIAKTGTDSRLPLLNRATQGRYPTGSVMKIATSLAVAGSGVYTTTQRFTCVGTWSRDGIIRTDWLPSGHGTLPLSGAITQSCNPYYYEAGYQMNAVDPFLMPTYLRQFGLGMPTGLTDIPEDRGNIGDPDTYRQKVGIPWTFADAVSMAIGQGEVEITPLQITRLVVAVANGGDLLRPFLVQRAGLFDDFSYTAEVEALSELGVSQDVLDTVRRGMCDVTTAYTGTATFIFETSPLQALGVCGKTGTAQNLGKGTTHAWFAAYAPREEPEIAVVVIVEDAGEGSGVAAPIVRQILESYFFGGS